MTEQELQIMGFIRVDKSPDGNVKYKDPFYKYHIEGLGTVYSCPESKANEIGEWFIKVGDNDCFEFYEMTEFQGLINLLDKRRKKK